MKKNLFLLILGVSICGCGGKKNAPQPDLTPGKTSLSLPAQNAVCTTGTILSPTESSVAFSWSASNNTSNYDLVVKNLLTSVSSTYNTVQTQTNVTLLRNTPYSWFIISKSNQTSATTQSDTWKFYNSGPGIVTYPPYPAELTAPAFGANVNSSIVDLIWKGSDIDTTKIASYDVYFGTTSTPPILKSAITDSFVKAVSVTAKSTYYWKVITRDVNGNTSDSGLSIFSTQ